MEKKSEKRWSEKHLRILETAFFDLKEALSTPVNRGCAQKIVAAYLAESPLGFASQQTLRERLDDPKILRKVPIFWPHLKGDFRTIVTTADDVEPVEIAMAFFEHGYLCFHTALFWNELSPQLPTNFFVATERKNPTVPAEPSEIDDMEMVEAFMKAPKQTSKVGHFGRYRFSLIERDHSNFLGVVEKKLVVSGRPVILRHTGRERSLLDISMHPHRCGGILNVIHAFGREGGQKFSLKKLIDYYEKLNPIYPYWQRIGLILKLAGNSRMEKGWRNHFGPPSRRFFLDRPYKTDWATDEEWNVAHPPGLAG